MISAKNEKKAKISSKIEELEDNPWGGDKPVPISSLLNAYVRPPNQIEIRGGHLYWNDVLHPTHETFHSQMDASKIKQLLNDFLYLAEATDQEIEKFARRWGVIGQCAHGLPYHHLPLPKYPRYVRDYIEQTKASYATRAEEIGAKELERILKPKIDEFLNTDWTEQSISKLAFWIENDSGHIENMKRSDKALSLHSLEDVQLPMNGLCKRVTDYSGNPVGDNLESYRHFAQEASAIIELASELREGGTGKKEHWGRILYNWDISKREEFVLPDYVGEHGMQYSLSIIINYWLEMTGVRPGVMWLPGSDPTFSLLGSTALFDYRPGENILSLVALQIMLMVTRRSGFGRCGFCGDWFDLKLGQSASRGCYCPDHREESYYNCVSARTYRRRNKASPNRPKRSRLTPEDHARIRSMWAKSKKTKPEFCKQMAEKYGRSERQIYNILDQGM